MSKEYTYKFISKDANGIIVEHFITINKRDSEEAIAKFESENPDLVWRQISEHLTN